MEVQSALSNPITPTSNSLSKSDWKEWIVQTLVYSIIIPVALVFLMALQSGNNLKYAGGMAYLAVINALVNLFGKYKQSA